ncbi:MAG: hypothetical protein KC646_07010 [Candidatus Cloacimonetes bacterium]|nr:hypothetical protein [Candidatus Cloacimonadota bacterium]
MKRSMNIIFGIIMAQPSYCYDDPNYLFIRAHSLEQQKQNKAAVELYRQITTSTISRRYKEVAFQKIYELDDSNFLETSFEHLSRLKGSDCFIVDSDIKKSYTWTGACENGLANSKGQLLEVLNDNSKVLVFDGKMKHGQRDAYGITYRMDKSVIYMGAFLNNQYHGEGKLYYKTGDLAYSGYFDKGQKTGNSKSFRPNGAMLYIGQYANNEFHGEGISYFEDGETYQGSVKNSTKDGYGIFTKLEGVIWDGDFSQGAFVGQWEQQIPQGLGAQNWVMGAKYQGGWKDRKRNFKGTLTWPNGKVYQGDWKDDLRHGEGELTYEDGTQYKGQFINDKITGIGELKLADGTSYVGAFQNNTFHGQGTWIDSNGNPYQGEWIHGDFAQSVGETILSTQDLIRVSSASRSLAETNENGVILTQRPQ